MYFCPKNPPYAATAFIINKEGNKFLSVSRKTDINDKGFPGGKLDFGENFVECCIREVKEETGLTVIRITPFFGDYCGKTERGQKIFWTLTFLCEVQGTITTKEAGKVEWISEERFFSGSFIEYNQDCFKLFNLNKQQLIENWKSNI